MKFWVASSLQYYVSGPSTLLCSLSCIEGSGQRVLDESFSTSRNVTRSDQSLWLGENRFTRLEANEPGDLELQDSATVNTTVKTTAVDAIRQTHDQKLDAIALPYLFPSRYAPSDRMRAIASDLFGGLESELAQVMAIEDWLFQNIFYQPGSSNEQSWALDTIETRTGVCRDFAHLGIAFCRALSIPARYVSVYAFGLYPQDFHAVFEVYIEGTWYLMDGTRKAPLNGIVRIANGHDASDAAVGTLFGNITSQWVNVQVEIADDEKETFVPVTRETLKREDKILFLG